MEVNIKFKVECPLPTLEELTLPEYCNGYVGYLTDEDFKSLLDDLICYLIVNNGILYDGDDIERAVAARTDVLYHLAQHPEMFWYRRDYDLLSQLITYACFKI
ncbi:MAG: hypothetical protein R3Y49_06645 [Rikenellaceae bacterium]